MADASGNAPFERFNLPPGTRELTLDKQTLLKNISRFYSLEVADLEVLEDEDHIQTIRLVFSPPPPAASGSLIVEAKPAQEPVALQSPDSAGNVLCGCGKPHPPGSRCM